MKVYEFSTSVTSDSQLIIPKTYTKDIPIGNSVRVILLVSEENLSIENEQDEFDDAPSLEEVIWEIKNTPQNPANIQPASGLLAEHLANSPEMADPLFDVVEWNREWDKIEAKMKMMEIAEQKSEADFELL